MSAEDKILDLRKRVPPERRASSRPRLDPSAAKSETCGSTSLRDGATIDRKHPIHLSPSEAHNRPIIIFVAACTVERREILATLQAYAAIVRAWKLAPTWLVGRYVILPDHVHLSCAPNASDAPSLERWMRCWKSFVTKSLGQQRETVWQRHHWDRQLRSGESYDNKWEYVRSNPVRHRLIADADAWLYQGELNELRW
jgi:REP element-mobilizing transposase RayT